MATKNTIIAVLGLIRVNLDNSQIPHHYLIRLSPNFPVPKVLLWKKIN